MLELQALRELPPGSRLLGDADSSCTRDFLVVDESNRVIWLSEMGERIVRQFSCDSLVLDAVFCNFSNQHDANDGNLVLTVAILLSSNYIRLHQSSGEHLDVKLSTPCTRIWAAPCGLLFQAAAARTGDPSIISYSIPKQQSDATSHYGSPMSPVSPTSPGSFSMNSALAPQQPVLFTLSHPTATPAPVHISSGQQLNESAVSGLFPGNHMLSPGAKAEGGPHRLLTEDTVVACSSGALLVTQTASQVHLWHMKTTMDEQPVLNPIMNTVMRGTMSSVATGASGASGSTAGSLGGWAGGVPAGPSLSLDAPLPLSRVHSGVSARSGSPVNAMRSLVPDGRDSPLMVLEGVLGDTGVQGIRAVDREAGGGSPLMPALRIDPSSTGGTASGMQAAFDTHNGSAGFLNSDSKSGGAGVTLHLLDTARLPEGESSDNWRFSLSGTPEHSSASINCKLTLHAVNANEEQYIRFLLQTSNISDSEESIDGSLVQLPDLVLPDGHSLLSLAHTCVNLVPGDNRATVGLHIILHQHGCQSTEASLYVGGTRVGALPLICQDDMSDCSLEAPVEAVRTHGAAGEIFLVTAGGQERLLKLPSAILQGQGGAFGPILAALSALRGGTEGVNMSAIEGCVAFLLLLHGCHLLPGGHSAALLLATFGIIDVNTLGEIASSAARAYTHVISDRPALRCQIFDAMHFAWEELLLQGAFNASAIVLTLGSALSKCSNSSASQKGDAYCEYYALHGVSLPTDVVTKGQDFTFYDSVPPSAAHWISGVLYQLNVSRTTEGMEVTHAAPELDLPPIGCPGLTLARDVLLRLLVETERANSKCQLGQLNLARALADAYISNDPQLTHTMKLPPIMRALVELALYECREQPAEDLRTWDDRILQKIGRHDLRHLKKKAFTSESHSLAPTQGDTSDGIHEVEAAAVLRFAEDERVHEACRMLRSSLPIYLRVEKAPETSDLDHRHRLQLRLLTLCRRSLACSVGRGMMTMGSLEPLMAEVLPVPKLNLTGRVPPNNGSVKLDTDAAPSELTLWPEFHNGVAAGLRVGLAEGESRGSSNTGQAPRVTRNWIVYNRTAANAAASAAARANSQGAVEAAMASHAGVLLALGLQGHLRVLSNADILDYLQQGHEPTTIAMLLGMAASKQGSAHPRLSKTLCCYIPSLLPSRHQEIDISPLVQTAALAGLGLLHVGTGHRLITEFLLTELGRKPTSDRVDCRESMSLTAAWSLGLVLLGQGSGTDMGSLADLHIEDRLHQLFSGGRKPAESYLFPTAMAMNGDSSTRPSRVLEGGDINTDVTGPGALIALALIYIRSGNVDIANRMALPHTVFDLERIRPDMLLYRAVGICLVMWDAVEPYAAWIDTMVPRVIKDVLFASNSEVEKENIDEKKPGMRNSSRGGGLQKLHPQTALSTYLCSITGLGLGMCLAYAGTGDERAKQAILAKLKFVQALRDNKPGILKHVGLVDKSMRSTIDMSVSVLSIGLSIVMAGTGDLQCLRIFRELRWKVDDVMYGCHLALGMAIGMLFLGGGTASVRRDNLSIACLLMAALPRFPSRTVDNQYHLQPLRHVYVLAVEVRVLRTVDVDSGQPVSVNVNIDLTSGDTLKMRAPCLLPELQTVSGVRVSSTREDRVTAANTSNVSISNSFQAGIDGPKKNRSLFTGSLALAGGRSTRVNDLFPTSLQWSRLDVNQGESHASGSAVPPMRVKRRVPHISANLSNSAENQPTFRIRSVLESLLDPFELEFVKEFSTEESIQHLEPSQGNDLTLELLINMLSGESNESENVLHSAVEDCEPMRMMMLDSSFESFC